MTQPQDASGRSLRVFCLEDNPLIVFHLEQMLEELGHILVGSAESFADLRKAPLVELDCALVDIDLADGRTGPDAVAWLSGRGVPSLFVTGQHTVAAEHSSKVLGVVSKPFTALELDSALALVPA